MASLSEENIKSLYRCENKTKRRQVLAKILDCSSCDSDEDDIKTSILLDFYLESVDFASERGFSWQQGLAMFELMKELLHSTLDLSLLQANEYLKKILQTYATTFPPQRLTSVIDFIFSFFFNHFHLYKFVFTKERDVDKTTTHLCIDTPPQDLNPLAKGTEKSEWEHQEALKKLEEEHNRKLMEKHSKLNSEVERLQSLVHEKLSLLNNEQPMTADDLKSIVKETVRIYVTEAGSAIQHSVEESQENLMYEFEKSAMDQDARHLCPAKKSALKAKSPSSALSKRKVKAAKPAKG